MKMYKFTVYAFDFEDYGVEEAYRQLDNMKYLMTTVYHQGTADIGEWHDDHELNKSSRSQLTFDKYFK